MKEPRTVGVIKDPDTKEYKLSTSVSFKTADIVSWAVGDVLDMLDAAFPASEQITALKKIVKDRLYKVTRDIQHQVYYAFGVEPYQLGDTQYIRDVLNGTDKENTSPNPAHLS